MPAELPFDRDVDREALERRRDENLRAERKSALKRELEAAELEARPDPRHPRTERKHFEFTVDELRRIDEAAAGLRLARATFVRRAALAAARKVGGSR